MNSIFYLSKSVFPSKAANSVHVMKMAQAFSRQGKRVALSALHEGENEMTDAVDLFESFGVDGSFDLHLFRAMPYPFRSIAYITRSLIRYRLGGYDLLFTRFPKAAAICALFGIKTVLELHDPSEQEYVRHYLRLAKKPIIVVITHALKDEVLKVFDCEKDIVIVAPDGADEHPLKVDPILPPVSSGRIRIGYLGHLYPGKGMEVIEKLAPRCPWADFEIVGGTDTDIRYWKDRLLEMPNVTFHGHKQHAETARYLASFDVALLPNQDYVAIAGRQDVNISRWTSPLKAFEYMAAGKAIVASNQDNLREVLEHRFNALLCEATDIDAWVDALNTLRFDQNLKSKLASNALKSFRENYTWNVRALHLLTSIEVRLYGRAEH